MELEGAEVMRGTIENKKCTSYKAEWVSLQNTKAESTEIMVATIEVKGSLNLKG